MNKKEFLITVIIVVLAIALIATIIVLKKLDASPEGTVGTTSGVAHDHDGDGIPDHGDDAHTNEDSEDNTTGTTSGDSASGNNEDAVISEDTDIDISVDLEDLPVDGANSGNTESGSADSGDTDSGSTESGSTDSGDTGSAEGGSTDTTEGDTEQGNTSGAVSGNEIDFDDLNNRGK